MKTRKLLFTQFIKKAAFKTIIFIIVMVLIMSIAQAIAPVISNDIAMGQLENSDELFVMMETYNKIKPIFDIVYLIAVGLFVVSLGKDTYKFAKTLDATNTETH